jgi:hypothetical protein
MPTPQVGDVVPVWIDDAEFARRLIARAVTQDRVDAALASLAADALPLSAVSAGLGGLVRVSVSGELGTPRVRPHVDVPGSYAVTVPGTLDLSVKLGGDSHLGADVEVDLALTPRPADPLLLVIDIAPVLPEHVRITTRAGGLGSTVAPFLGVVLEEIRRQVARGLTSMLDSPKVRAGRTIDVGARIDGRQDSPPPEPWVWIDDATFGARFLRAAVTLERLTNGFAGLAGTPLAIGPLSAGPRDMATVTANGVVGTPVVTEAAGRELAFDARLPVELDLVVSMGRENHYRAAITIHLHPVVRPAEPLVLVLEIPPVTSADVTVDVEAKGHLAGLLGRLGHLEDQLRSQVVANVNTRLADPSGRTFDIGARVDGA